MTSILLVSESCWSTRRVCWTRMNNSGVIRDELSRVTAELWSVIRWWTSKGHKWSGSYNSSVFVDELSWGRQLNQDRWFRGISCWPIRREREWAKQGPLIWMFYKDRLLNRTAWFCWTSIETAELGPAVLVFWFWCYCCWTNKRDI